VIFKEKKIIIIGAGPSGLATAWGLTDKGFDVDVYDAASIPGGLAGSEIIEGMTVDYGPHIYHTHDKNLEKLWIDNFGDLLEEKEFFSKNYKDGVLYDYPLSYESIEDFPDEIRDKVKFELDNLRPQDMKRATNFKEVVTAIVGPTLQNLFFEAYTQKLWGIPTVKMSAKWAPKRIEIRKTRKSFWYNQFSAAAIYGSGKIMERIVEKIEHGGNRVLLNHKLVKADIDNSKISKLNFENGVSISTDDKIVISTIPLNNLCDTVGLKCDLRFNSVILAYLVFDIDYVLPKNVQSIYFAHESTYFHRVSEQKKFSSKNFPANKTVLTFEISYTNRQFLKELSEEQLLSDVLEQFSSLGFVDKNLYTSGFTRDWSAVNPILEAGFENEFIRINSFLSALNNLHSIGGSAEFIYGDVQVMFSKAHDMVDLLTSEHYAVNKNIKHGEPFLFNTEVVLDGFRIGGDSPTVIIAEIGLNHNGDYDMAKQLIDEAKKSGCDYAKLQTFSAEDRVSATAKGAKYADKTLSMEETIHEMFERLQLSRGEQASLFDYAKKIGMPLISTPFSERDVDFLVEMGVSAFKLASFDIVNISFIKYVASKQLPLIISTGMSGMAEIEEALEAVASERNPNVILLHCVSSYPTNPVDVNLRSMESMRKAFRVPVGYSDHTIGTLVPTMSMSLGAHVLEKHFTLDTALEGSDHILSSTPKEMSELVNNRDIIYSALGTGVKKPRPIEYAQINQQRKSLFVSEDLKAGDVLNLQNVTIKGPGHGIQPKFYQLIMGKKVVRNIDMDSPITWDDMLME
jgi:sialic acid synthase SpsE/protoporphyrinogen oxidase